MRLTIQEAVGLSVCSICALVGVDADAQCSKDTDCKGTRVCVDGKCAEYGTSASPSAATPVYQPPAYQQTGVVYPPAAPSNQQPMPAYPPGSPVYPVPAMLYPMPAAPVVPGGPPRYYQTVYFQVGGIMGFHGWGGMSVVGVEPTFTGRFKGGVTLAGYVPVSPHVHLGAYFDYSNGEVKAEFEGIVDQHKADHYSVGASLKAGMILAERIWLGVVGDLGFYTLDYTGDKAWYGLEVSPRIHLDVLAVDSGGFRFGPFVSLGPSFVPYINGTSLGDDARAYLIYLQLRLGATFGS